VLSQKLQDRSQHSFYPLLNISLCFCVFCHTRTVGDCYKLCQDPNHRISCRADRTNKQCKKFTICCRGDPFKESNGPILTEIRSKCVVKFTALIQGSPSFCIVTASPSSVELVYRKTGERGTVREVTARMYYVSL
jgi:hypothetical protein